ncbi:hypothetical protein JCGZ_14957 [Jatropha curcas]|uniref:Aminotransferase-like plant mobile domain-containing protein n=1 Tax=Jatropha curcas TaxID=180498 RepID=A0A067KKC9_JATCU|nr:hypothetical protein JCGZ_14957 [Jatropha curcas]
MGRKKDKGKAISKQDSDSPTKALSEHSTDLSKTLNTTKDLKKWIEELSQSPEVLKALQSMASSSAEDPGMSSKTKAIVAAHDTAIPSQTVDGKELSNPLMAVDLPKIQYGLVQPNSTQEDVTLGAIPNIPIFEGERVPVNRNALTPGTRSLQLLPLPGTEFPVRHETGAMRGFQTEVDLGKAHAGGSSIDASAFWDLLDPPMRSRVVAASFGDYAAGLRRTLPRFPPAMCYALMKRWNDCTHTFIFGFGEMTLTPVDYTAITGLEFDGPVAPLDARYQTAALGAELAERIRTRLAAWRELPEDVRPAAPAYTREERDRAARSFIFYLISSQLLCTSQNKRDPVVLACLRDLSRVGSYSWASLALAHLYHGLDVWTRGSGESNWLFLRPLEVWAYEYQIYLGGPASDASADARQIPRYLAHRHHTFSSSEDPHYWRCYLNDRALSNLLLTPWEGDAWDAYPARAVAEAYTHSRFLLRGYWLDRYFLGERIYELQVATAQRRVADAPPRHMCLLEGMNPRGPIGGVYLLSC